MSAAGTLPENPDPRPPDILRDKGIQQRAVDPKTFAPPELPKIAGPGFSFSLQEEAMRSIAKDAIKDVFKTLQINGVSPDISLGRIDFTLTSAKTAPLVQLEQGPVSVPTNPESLKVGVEVAKGFVVSLEQEEPAPTFSSGLGQVSAEKLPGAKVPQTAPSGLVPLLVELPKGAVVADWATKEVPIDKNSTKMEVPRKELGKIENRLPKESYGQQVDREQKEIRSQDLARGLQRRMAEGRLTRGDKLKLKREERKERREEQRRRKSKEARSSSDATVRGDTYIPIRLTRADGARSILTLIPNDFTAVLEGATSGERTKEIPPSDTYYTAGGIGDQAPWQLFDLNTEDKTVRVRPGLVNQFIAGDPSEVISWTGTTFFIAHVTTNGTELTGVSITTSSTPPAGQTPGLFAGPSSVDVPFALIADGVIYRLIGPGNITLSLYEALRTDTDTVEFGRLNYNAWYCWKIES